MDESSPAPPRGILANIKTYWPQYAAAAAVALLYISYYLANHIHTDMYENVSSWPNLEEMDDMMLSSSIAGILSFPVFAFLFEKLNRKICAYIISVIFLITCILHKTAYSHFWFHVAHSLSAIGGTGSFFFSAIYVTEIAQDDIRGSLLMVVELLYSATHAAVVFCEEFIWRISFSWIAIVPPVVSILCFAFWLPETPVYFLRRGNRDAATRSLQWLRRGGTTESLAQEVDDLEEVLKATRSDDTNFSSVFRDLFNRRTLKYSGIAIVLHLTYQFCGHRGTSWVVSTLPVRLGRDMYDVVYSLAQVASVAGTFMAFWHCDKRGRRTLLLISTVVCSICLVPIAICSHVMTAKDEISAEKVFAIIFSIAFEVSFNMGINYVIIVVLVDMFPPNILVIQLVISGIMRYMLDILEEKYIYINPWDLKVLHPGLFWVHTAVCAAGALFTFKYLPETKQRPAGFLFMENSNMLLRNI